MWGLILALVGFVCIVIANVILIRTTAVLSRSGLRVLVNSALVGLPADGRRAMLRAIRRGELVSPEYRDVAQRWARIESMRRGFCWMSIPMVVVFGCWLPFVAAGSLTFWCGLGGMCMFVASTAYQWRDQMAASRLLRVPT